MFQHRVAECHLWQQSATGNIGPTQLEGLYAPDIIDVPTSLWKLSGLLIEMYREGAE
jgi:hypothetical protein